MELNKFKPRPKPIRYPDIEKTTVYGRG